MTPEEERSDVATFPWMKEGSWSNQRGHKNPGSCTIVYDAGSWEDSDLNVNWWATILWCLKTGRFFQPDLIGPRKKNSVRNRVQTRAKVFIHGPTSNIRFIQPSKKPPPPKKETHKSGLFSPPLLCVRRRDRHFCVTRLCIHVRNADPVSDAG